MLRFHFLLDPNPDKESPKGCKSYSESGSRAGNVTPLFYTHLEDHFINERDEVSCHSEVPPLVLLELDTLEERLEVARPESLVAVALDQLDEHRRPVLQRLREDLQPQRFPRSLQAGPSGCTLLLLISKHKFCHSIASLY